MNTQIGKWGNSLGVRIPGALAKELGLHDGSEVDLQQVEGTLVLRPKPPRGQTTYSLDELLSMITPETLQNETQWGEPQGKEEW